MKVSPFFIAGTAIVLIAALVSWHVLAPVVRIYQDERNLAETGVKDIALVVRASPTGTVVNEQPLVQLTLERHAPDLVYRAEVSQVVPLVYLPRVQPGMRVPVLADAGNKQRMVIDFDRLDGFTDAPAP